MKFLKMSLFLLLVVSAHGGKVIWGSNGKPKIETSSIPIKGCSQGGLDSLGDEKNTTSCS